MSISKKIFIFVSVSSITIALLFPFRAIFAQTPPQRGFDLTVSPVFFDLNAKPGDTITNQIKIRNNSNAEIPIKVEVKKIGGDTRGDLTIQDVKDDSTISWIEIKDKELKAKPKEWTTIPFTLTIPQNAAYGYYWGISFTQNQDTNLKGSGAGITGSLVVPILLNVKKEGAKTEGKIVNFKTDNSWYEYVPVSFSTTFANTGNVHIRPRGNIFIKDFLGKQVATLEVNSTQGSVLPNTNRVFDAKWDDSFMYWEDKMTEDGKPVLDKDGKPQRDLKFRFDKILNLRIGKYTATTLMIVNTDTRDIVYEAQTSFVVFPWKIIAGTIVFTLFAAVGFFITLKSFGKKLSGLTKRIFKNNN